jgi:predicted secreted hydrolase
MIEMCRAKLVLCASLRMLLALFGAMGAVAVSAADNGPAPATADRLSALRADERPGAFELAVRPRPFAFPRDHGPHSGFRHEWWYLTGHLDAVGGEPFGFELTFFRFALKPPDLPDPAAQGAGHPRADDPTRAAGPAEFEARDVTGGAGRNAVDRTTAAATASAWRSRQIYMAHFAITDIERGRFHVAERFARDALGLAGAQADPFRVSLDNWSLGVRSPGGAPRELSQPPTETQRTSAAGERDSPWHLVASDGSYSLDLELTAASPIMLNGDAGLSQKSGAPGAASYYYSIPRMTAKGRLIRDGKPLDVKGTVWLDREWGSGSLGSDQQGWDWFALQLDDGSALMFYALRKRDGRRDSHSSGTWLSAGGTIQTLASNEVQIDATNHWTSPRGGRYPARWNLRVPRLNLEVDIEPRLADQELNTSTRYWEGASLVRGTQNGKPISGKAYVELVGYATR